MRTDLTSAQNGTKLNTADEFQRATVGLRSTKEIAKRCDRKNQ
jgi:hypothetical protein